MAMLFGTALARPLPPGEGWGEGAGNLRSFAGTLTRPAAGLSLGERQTGEGCIESARFVANGVASMAFVHVAVEVRIGRGHGGAVRVRR